MNNKEFANLVNDFNTSLEWVERKNKDLEDCINYSIVSLCNNNYKPFYTAYSDFTEKLLNAYIEDSCDILGKLLLLGANVEFKSSSDIDLEDINSIIRRIGVFTFQLTIYDGLVLKSLCAGNYDQSDMYNGSREDMENYRDLLISGVLNRFKILLNTDGVTFN